MLQMMITRNSKEAYLILKDYDFQSAMDYDHVDFQLKLNQLIAQGRDMAFNLA